jgi:hypothetical protein
VAWELIIPLITTLARVCAAADLRAVGHCAGGRLPLPIYAARATIAGRLVAKANRKERHLTEPAESTARITCVSDMAEPIKHGVALRVRSVQVSISCLIADALVLCPESASSRLKWSAMRKDRLLG